MNDKRYKKRLIKHLMKALKMSFNIQLSIAKGHSKLKSTNVIEHFVAEKRLFASFQSIHFSGYCHESLSGMDRMTRDILNFLDWILDLFGGEINEKQA